MRLRLLADDLTGALDSAARFVPVAGAVTTVWSVAKITGSIAIDGGTRELDAFAASAATERLAPLLDDGEPAFKKIDSLLRGHVAAELAACLTRFDHCIVAPAFPFQGRVTRGGRQMLRGIDVGVDLVSDLAGYGVRTKLCRPGDAAPAGVSLWDAESDVDLDAVVAAGRGLSPRVLWCGTGGLAGALAGHGTVPSPQLSRPILALIGSDHPISVAQLAACGRLTRRMTTPDPQPIARMLVEEGAIAVALDLPQGTTRVAAAHRITQSFAALIAAVPHPGTLVVAGGATLRSLCDALGATSLEVDGEIEPGAPCSVMRGGSLDGQRTVSKSGAFGEAQFLARLLTNC